MYYFQLCGLSCCKNIILLHAFVNETPGVSPTHSHHNRPSLFKQWFPAIITVEPIALKQLARHRYDSPVKRKSFEKALLNVRHRVLAEARSTDENDG